MIKINLATRKQAQGLSAGATGEATGSLQSVFTRMTSATGGGADRTAAVRKFVFFVLIVAFAEYSFEDYKAGELKKVETKQAKIVAETARLQGEVAKTAGYQETKKSLESDEALIRTKISTIQTLLSKKSQPGKMLTAISKGIPQQVWLSEFNLADATIHIKGQSTGFDVISDLLKSLEESAYFTDLTLVNSQQEKDDLGVETASFEISAKRRQQ